MELKINHKHPFGTSKEILYNGSKFLGYEKELDVTKIDSDPINLRARSHLIVLDLLKELEKEGKVVSHFEGANTHTFVLESRFPQKGSLRSDQVTYHKVEQIKLIIDKKELLPLALYFREKWGLFLVAWDDYKFGVSIDEKKWELDENTDLNEDKWFFYEDENGVDESYRISSKQVFYEETELVNCDPKSFELLKPVTGTVEVYRRNWAKDKNHVFNQKEIIEKADPETIILLNQYHAKDKEHYIMGSNAFKNDSTFIVFPNLMAKNKEGVYYRNGSKFKEADPASFIYLNDFYQKDKDRVFFERKILDADATTFKAVENEMFGYDENAEGKIEESSLN